MKFKHIKTLGFTLLVSAMVTLSGCGGGGGSSNAVGDAVGGDDAILNNGEQTATNNGVNINVAFKPLAAGAVHTVAIKSDGTLWAWGFNFVDSLGVGEVAGDIQTTPMQVGSDNTWQSVSAGQSHTAALKSDGTLWAWGGFAFGQTDLILGISPSTPMQVGSDTWQSVSAGDLHTAAIHSNGTLWTWGMNSYGELGEGEVTDNIQKMPMQVGSDTWQSVSAGSHHTAAILSNGTLWAWGTNSYGELGVGEVTGDIQSTPMQVGSDTWQSVSAGPLKTAAIKSNGTLWAWGFSIDGGAGINYTPIQIGSDNTWQSVSPGKYHIVAMKNDGTLWAWGTNNGLGVLGVGEDIMDIQTTPIQVGSDNTWQSVSAGDHHTAAMKRDGSVWAWGSNTHGQLGVGEVLDIENIGADLGIQYAPVKIY